jgi:hypothetical protein
VVSAVRRGSCPNSPLPDHEELAAKKSSCAPMTSSTPSRCIDVNLPPTYIWTSLLPISAGSSLPRPLSSSPPLHLSSYSGCSFGYRQPPDSPPPTVCDYDRHRYSGGFAEPRRDCWCSSLHHHAFRAATSLGVLLARFHYLHGAIGRVRIAAVLRISLHFAVEPPDLADDVIERFINVDSRLGGGLDKLAVELSRKILTLCRTETVSWLACILKQRDARGAHADTKRPFHQ